MTINTAKWDDCYDDSYDDPDDFDDEFADEPDFDCGFIPSDGCLLAGTEDCDFECPYRDALVRNPNYPNCSIFGTDLSSENELPPDDVVQLI
jgi:hypothetical protein